MSIASFIPELSHTVVISPELNLSHLHYVRLPTALCVALAFRTFAPTVLDAAVRIGVVYGGDVLLGRWYYIRTGVYLSHLHSFRLGVCCNCAAVVVEICGSDCVYRCGLHMDVQNCGLESVDQFTCTPLLSTAGRFLYSPSLIVFLA